MQPKTLFLIIKKKKRCLSPGQYLSNFHTTKEIGPLVVMDLTHFDTENENECPDCELGSVTELEVEKIERETKKCWNCI